MALEDFFTLTEMKDGLTIPARVEELVAVMKQEKDCFVKNVGDAMRQWSTVANVIAVTENKDCLDLFIQLDGLLFIDGWLKDAQKLSADASDCLIEESILALLQALQKLKIDNEKLTSSGICLTVRDLLSHKSNNIQEKAKTLLGNLKPPNVSGMIKLDSEQAQPFCGDRTDPVNRLAVESDASVSSSALNPDQKVDVDRHVHQLVGDNAAGSGCVKPQSEGVEALVKESDKVGNHYSESDLKDVKDKLESSPVIKEECSSVQKSASDCPDTEQGTDLRKEGRSLESLPEIDNAEKVNNESLPNKLGKSEVYPASIMSKPVETSSSLDKDFVLEIDGKAVRGTDSHVDSSTTKTMSADQPMGGTSTRADDSGVLMSCTATLAQRTSGEGDESCTKTSQHPLVDGSMAGKAKDLGSTFSQTDKLSSIDEFAHRVKHKSRHLRDSGGFESSRGRKSVDVTSKMSAMDLEYGTVDALDFACLVAKEVERQVNEDNEEQFGSFSKNSSRGDPLHLAGSPDSYNGKEDENADGSPSHESPAEKMSDDDSSGEDGEPSTNSDNVETNREKCLKVEETAPEAANSADRGTSEIDLNMEICSEAEAEDEDDAHNFVSTPVTVISASRAVAAPGLPASPLEFEGDLGWKGSAATSAFRPASPRRTSDGDRSVLVEEAPDASREEQDFVFDLNLLAEDGDDKIINPLSSKQNLTSPPCEPSPRRSEKLSFDLNQMSEDGETLFSSSPASSSSSLKPAMRNFDLNDRPLNFVDPSDPQPYLATSSHKATAYVGSSDDSVISIMGAKVKKSTFVQQAPFSFFNGLRASEPVVDNNLARSGPFMAAPSNVQYAPHPIYTYNGIAVGPTMSFSPPMYGPGGSVGGSPAYMVDSRGVSMVPQFMGAPPSTFQASYPHQQPSYAPNMMGQMGPLPIPNGASSSRPHLSYNPGFVTDAPNRVDAGGFRQFIPSQVRSSEEHHHLQSLFPGIVGGKRKEPDGGWEPYATNYKHHQPPHL